MPFFTEKTPPRAAGTGDIRRYDKLHMLIIADIQGTSLEQAEYFGSKFDFAEDRGVFLTLEVYEPRFAERRGSPENSYSTARRKFPPRAFMPLTAGGGFRFRVGSERHLEEMLFCLESRRFAALGLAHLQYFRYARPCLLR